MIITITTMPMDTPIITMTDDTYRYLKDPAEIYALSFETVRAEANLTRLAEDQRDIAIRLVHACGMPDIVDDLVFTENAVAAGRTALRAHAPIFIDATMVGAGIIDRHLTENDIICTLNDEGVAEDAKTWGTTRSAAAVDRWRSTLGGAVVAVGNAPTALFRLLELIADGAPKPAVVLGFPVGFVGAAESKDALAENQLGLEFITLRGRRGGSAMASAAVNALAAGLK
jgi:precorrin-8X/cobalt-precorrin-8 methylmutase